MRVLFNILAIMVMMGFVGPVMAQSSAVVLNETQTDESDDASERNEKTPKADTNEDKTQKLSACDARIERITRSAARKMMRALNPRERLRAHELGERLELEIDGQSITWRVLSEYDGRVAALMQPGTSTSWVAARSEKGPVIARIDWNSGCAVDQTQLAFPDGPTIEFEPFRYWGARVQWRLPRDRDESASLVEALRSAMQ